jgi:hypothetical protein
MKFVKGTTLVLKSGYERLKMYSPFVLATLLFAFFYSSLSGVKIETDFLVRVNYILLLGILAGVFQVIGYIYYLRDSHIDPNPVTWFMFAYGTFILAILEWDSYATLPELILPVACAILSVVVSIRCWVKARKADSTRWWPNDWWPETYWDKFSFVADLIITLAYLSVWFFASYAILNSAQQQSAILIFLFLSNLSTFPAFFPIIRTTYVTPWREHWLPWFIWSFAYLLLAIVTYLTHGAVWHHLMFFPLSNLILHAIVAVLALRNRKYEIEALVS